MILPFGVKIKSAFDLLPILLLISISFLSGCKNIVPAPETPAISFEHDVLPVIAANCTQSGCHGTKHTEKFSLTTYDDIMKHGEINTSDAGASKLYQVIVSKGGENQMPPPPNRELTDQEIAFILLWIKQGANNN